jgi:ABC-2 type transport system permease protein
MLAKMFLFEWNYFRRQPSFYITCGLFFLLGFFYIISDALQIGGNIKLNSPYNITMFMSFMTIFAMFLVVNFVADTAMRNDSTQMSELLYCKPINPFAYQLGRFLGAFAMVVTTYAMLPLGILLGASLGSVMGWVDADLLINNQLNFYFVSLFYFSVPTLFTLSCLFYACAVKFRSMMSVYLMAVALFILYLLSGKIFNDPSQRELVALLDPFAIKTFAELSRYWTIIEKNSTVIEFSGVLLQNRLLWLTVSVIILVLLSGLTKKFTLAHKTAKKEKTAPSLVDFQEKLHNKIDYNNNNNSLFTPLWLRVKFEVQQVIFTVPFIVLAILCLFLLISSLINDSGFYGTSQWPLTHLMISAINGASSLLILIVVIYYSAEIVWRDRNSGMGDIIDAMPVPNITFWLSKIIANSLVIVLLFTFFALITMSYQQINDAEIELSQYIFRLGYLSFLPWIMNIVMAFLLQVLSPNKYVGMLLFIVFIMLGMSLNGLGFEHNMFQFGASSAVPYSDLNTYGDFLVANGWYQLYWLGLTVVLASLTYALWHRGPVKPLKERLKKINYYLATSGKLVITLGLVIFIGAGSYIHYNTRVLNDYITSEQWQDAKEKYEKTLEQHAQDAIPTIIKVNANFDLYPKQRKLIAIADVVIVNKSDKAIEQFMVHRPNHSDEWNVEISGGKLGPVDTSSIDFAWFKFDQPLQPNESRKGKISVVRAHKGFTEGNYDDALVENGTFLNSQQIFPSFGYSSYLQIVDKHERKKRGLLPTKRMHKLEQNEFYNESSLGKGNGFIAFEATVTTDEDQIAIVPGYLQSESVENGRRTFHYKMNAPMKNYYALTSGKYEVEKQQHNGVNIEVYYHKSHNMNVARMIESVRDSIDYYSKNFGPYQHEQMRIIEFPRYRSFAQSFANTIPFSESMGFTTDLRDEDNIDVPYYVTAHEVAHQWWGHQVGSANVQGSAIISESLSQYAALMVMKEKYGEHKLRKFLAYELDTYLKGRAAESIEEMPLLRSEQQQYIHYQKGSIIMAAVRDVLGEEKLNKTLAAFLAKYKYQSAPYPTSLDLLEYIVRDADVQQKDYITSLFENIAIYDLKTTNVVTTDRDDGQFDLTITLDAKLNFANGEGVETEQPLTQMIDIGLFSEDPNKIENKEQILYLKKHGLVSGENTIVLTVKEKPSYVGIDPFVKLVDRDSKDNIYQL